MSCLFISVPPKANSIPLATFRSLPVRKVIVMASPRSLIGVVIGGTFGVTRVVGVPMLKVMRGCDCIGYPSYKGRVGIFNRDRVSRVTTRLGIPMLKGVPVSVSCTAGTSNKFFTTVSGRCVASTLTMVPGWRGRILVRWRAQLWGLLFRC